MTISFLMITTVLVLVVIVGFTPHKEPTTLVDFERVVEHVRNRYTYKDQPGKYLFLWLTELNRHSSLEGVLALALQQAVTCSTHINGMFLYELVLRSYLITIFYTKIF